jgi:nitrate/TMAO reductase-like tetraheme cytochrome c subunit
MGVRQRVRSFFSPPRGARLWRRVLPWGTLLAAFVVIFMSGSAAWEYTNSPQFCGTTCHTMPPEYSAYQVSPHARILCVECHIGRDFMGGGFVLRKAGDLKHVFATVFSTYKFPIYADEMRPARETCERCHSPEKFANDSFREIKRYASDVNNTPTSIYLSLKTGGGTKRQGLGLGIHWHIESKVYYLPLDPPLDQSIPFVRVVDDTGKTTDYVDVGSNIDPAKIDPSKLQEMDCMTCHNRITHLIPSPDDGMDQLLARGIIATTIPEIRLRGGTALKTHYDTTQQAMDGIAALKGFYQQTYPDFYAAHSDQVTAAIAAIQDTYKTTFFPEQQEDWATHPNNVGHKLTAGCFRCHDGKHMDAQQQPIRLECNLCHSIPVVVGPDQFVAKIEISRGPEPQSHLNANWLGQHRFAFDSSCAACHTTSNPGGHDNTSFCSNSACHGNTWEYAGLNAPGLPNILKSQLPTPVPTLAPVSGGALTYNDTIGPLFQARCSGCHGDTAIQGLKLTTYQTAMAGGKDGPVIVAGDPANSLLIKKQSGAQPHFAQLTPDELKLVTDWIKAGAPEK